MPNSTGRLGRGLGDEHFGGTDQSLVQNISFLYHLHDSIGLGLMSRHHGHCFMFSWIEFGTGRIQLADTKFLHRCRQLLEGQFDAFP